MLRDCKILLTLFLLYFVITKIESRTQVEIDPGVSQSICAQTTRFYSTNQIQIASFDQFAHELVINENCKAILWDYSCDKAKKLCDKFVCKPRQKQKRNINHGPGRNKNYIFVRTRPNNGANPFAERPIKTSRAVNNVHVSKGGRSPNSNHGLKSGRAPLSSRTMAKPYTFCNSTLNDTNNSETLIQGYTTPRYYPYTHDPYSNQTDPFEMFLNKTENFTEFANDTGYFPKEVNGTVLPNGWELIDGPIANNYTADDLASQKTFSNKSADNVADYLNSTSNSSDLSPNAVGRKPYEAECYENSECESKFCCPNPGFEFWEKACFSNCSAETGAEYFWTDEVHNFTVNKKVFHYYMTLPLTWVQAVRMCISKNSTLADMDEADQSKIINETGSTWSPYRETIVIIHKARQILP